jgi:hypothetical protein
MKHPSNRILFEHWNERRGARPAPERADIDPAAIRQVLGNTFVLAADGIGNPPFRLAGTRLCALFGCELKGESFVELWHRPSRTAMRELIMVVMEEKIGVVASSTAAAADPALAPISLELLLLPLAHRGHGDARLLGAMAPMAAPYWLGVKPVGPLSLGMFRHIGPAVDQAPPTRLAAETSRLRHGLTVYDGGRSD